MRTTHRLLIVVAAAGLAVGCQPPPPPAPPPAPKKAEAPPPKKLMTLTAKTPDATTALTAAINLESNSRQVEAIDQYNKALASDPDCALAHAGVGSSTPGSEGMTHLAKAEELAANLPEAEKDYILSLAARHRGEGDKSEDLLKSAVAAAPDDSRLTTMLGLNEQMRGQTDDAASTLEKATQLDPKNGAAWNGLGYTKLAQGKVDDAITALQKYAEASPNEPNPQDSLGEALMTAGRFDEAETAYNKALTIQPSFAVSWDGIALTRFFKGDWKGGREALDKERAAWTRPVDQHEVDITRAWSYVAEGKMADAMKTLDDAEKTAKTASLDVAQAYAPLDRAHFLIIENKAAQALPLCDQAVKIATDMKLPAGNASEVTRYSLMTRLWAEAKLGKGKDAATTLTSYQAEAAKAGTSPRIASQIAFAQAEAALASKDTKAALDAFSKCANDEFTCQLERARTQKASGDAAGTGTTVQALLSTHRRDMVYPWIESQAKTLAPPPARTN